MAYFSFLGQSKWETVGPGAAAAANSGLVFPLGLCQLKAIKYKLVDIYINPETFIKNLNSLQPGHEATCMRKLV